jgi:hypothetical protein
MINSFESKEEALEWVTKKYISPDNYIDNVKELVAVQVGFTLYFLSVYEGSWSLVSTQRYLGL